MKVRTGFVSNSSSSSFIVSVPKEKDCQIEIKMSVDLSSYGRIIKTEKQLRECFKDRFDDYMEDDYSRELFEKCLKAIKKGEIIVAGSFCDDGTEAVEQLLCQVGLEDICPSKVKVIENEGGY